MKPGIGNGHAVMKRLITCIAAVTGLAGLQPALADDTGPYAVLAGGRTTYDADCGYFGGCSGGRGTTVKLGAGYRFGVFALESWAVDWGRSPIAPDDHLHLSSFGVGGAWRMHFGETVQGLLRAGGAMVRQRRDAEDFRHLEGTFGLGLSVDVAPATAIELAWDVTTSTGGSDHIGSVLAQAVTLGLRLRF